MESNRAGDLEKFINGYSDTIERLAPERSEDDNLKFYKISTNGYAPTKATPASAGFDLYSAHDYIVPSNGKALCMTDISILVPKGCYGRIAPRSGLANKNFIDVGAGVIDRDYSGNIGVILFNFGIEEFKVSVGDRIAQLICERISYPKLIEDDKKNIESERVDKHGVERGCRGFGSSGV